MQQVIPFGLTFEETLISETGNQNSRGNVFYDETEDISFVLNMAGNRIPYILFGAPTETQTVTKIAREGNDTD